MVRTERVETAEEWLSRSQWPSPQPKGLSATLKQQSATSPTAASPDALRILLAGKIENRGAYVLWAPVHISSLAGKEAAHGAA